MGGDTSEEGYTVGYAKPPLHSRFQKGQSGNPAGGRKGLRSLSQDISDALDEMVAVNLNGRRRRVTKRQAGLIQLSNKFAQGDLRATKLMLDLVRQADQDEALKAILDAADEPPGPGFILKLPDNGR